MSFDKDYPKRKDRRKPYYKSKRFDTSCRNHGSCSWCRRNKLYQAIREIQRIKDLETEYIKEEDLTND